MAITNSSIPLLSSCTVPTTYSNNANTVYCPRSLSMEIYALWLNINGIYGYIDAVSDHCSLETIAGCSVSPLSELAKSSTVVVNIIKDSIIFKGITVGDTANSQERRSLHYNNTIVTLPIGFVSWLHCERLYSSQRDSAIQINNRIFTSTVSEGLNGAIEGERPIFIRSLETITIKERFDAQSEM